MMGVIKKITLLVILAVSVLVSRPETVISQSVLERISVTERADGLGFVVRYHLTQPINSFDVAQTDDHRIQVILHSADLDVSEYLKPDTAILTEISEIELKDAMGFELFINEEFNFSTTSYFDVNQRDVLISLVYTDEITEHNASLFTPPADALPVTEAEDTPQPDRADDTETRIAQITEEPTLESGSQKISRLDRLLPDDPFEHYTRSFTTAGANNAYLLRPSTAIGDLAFESHPWMNHPFFNDRNRYTNHNSVVFYSPTIFRSYNTEIPMGSNDGALWQGRGVNYQFSAGVGAVYGPLTFVFRPSVVVSENREFELSPRPRLRGLSQYAMPLTNSDIPERFGNESINKFDLGDSFIELDYKVFSAGISNHRIWSGPAIYNPLIFSYNAPGFLHTYLGTRDPFEFRYGRIETKWFWGGLQESGFFDEDTTNDLRIITGLLFNYSPSVIPGLHLGFNRTAFSYYPAGGPGLSDIFMAFRLSQPDHVGDIDEAFHSMMSFFGRWVFPEAGFELYAEWGRNDNRRRFRDLIAEPELNRGYVLGFIKNFNISTNRYFQLITEITNVENSSVTSQQRDFNTWYEHEVIRQGFTNRGQVLGANIGPGSSTQIMRLSYYEKRGMIGISAQRVAMQNDRYHRFRDTYRDLYPWPQYWFMIDRHMVQMNYGFHGLAFLPYGFEVQLDYHIANFENLHNMYNNDLKNHHFMLTMRYNVGIHLKLPN